MFAEYCDACGETIGVDQGTFYQIIYTIFLGAQYIVSNIHIGRMYGTQ